ncbi:MAG: HK97 family phage prohead protease [Succinivibrio sp.]|nr:HK97 family phage prohead protease [Succinivibrio sp.]
MEDLELFCKNADPTRLEIKAGGEEGSVEGYASVFNSVDSYGDTMLPGAFDNVIKSGELPLMFYNHYHFEIPVGKWDSMETDDFGLKVKGRLNLDLKEAQDVYSALKFGSVSGLSIGFQFGKKDYTSSKQGRSFKNIARLPEISIVAMPAESKARISDVKSNLSQVDNIRDFEACLRDLGASKKGAQELVSKARELFAQPRRDADGGIALKNIGDTLKVIDKLALTIRGN